MRLMFHINNTGRQEACMRLMYITNNTGRQEACMRLITLLITQGGRRPVGASLPT